MDKTNSGKTLAEEVTRESLIAISYAEPEKVVCSKLSSENLNGEKLVDGANHDDTEKYRSELISISYSESPDIKASPVTEQD